MDEGQQALPCPSYALPQAGPMFRLGPTWSDLREGMSAISCFCQAFDSIVATEVPMLFICFTLSSSALMSSGESPSSMLVTVPLAIPGPLPVLREDARDMEHLTSASHLEDQMNSVRGSSPCCLRTPSGDQFTMHITLQSMRCVGRGLHLWKGSSPSWEQMALQVWARKKRAMPRGPRLPVP